MERPKVSVIIPTREHFDLLVNAINQLCIKTTYPNYEVIVVSTGDDKDVTAKIKTWCRETTSWPVKFFEKTGDFNFAKVNTAAAYEYVSEDTKYLLFMNDDCEPVNDVMSIMVDFYENNEDIGTVSAQIRHKDERIQSMGYAVYEYENHALELIQDAAGQMDNLFYSRAFAVTANPAICMLTSKELFQTLGGLSDVYIEDYADIEYSLKCLLEGKKNWCLGYAITLHYAYQTRGVSSEMKQRVAYDYQMNLAPFMDFYKAELREEGAFRYKDRRLLQKNWCLGESDKIETNFKDHVGGDVFRDPAIPANLQMQIDFEKRYDLHSDDGKLHVLMIGHKDGCGWVRVDNPAYMINKCMPDMVAFPYKCCNTRAN